MIAVDTSALMAVLLDEPEAPSCMAKLKAEPTILISAVTQAEALIVAGRRGIGQDMIKFLGQFGFQVVPVIASTAQRVANAYDRWGKGVHPASLNFCDCFAYDVAQSNNCKLLFVGTDFSKTDVKVALDDTNASRP